MSNSLWITPEEKFRLKKRKKTILYFSIMVGTVLLSALVTILANKI
ncbi:hypothetical protein NDK43_31060 [Neobacillus pocheonensis]|uniref:Uncharacterized protein n=1 Tax=Neobacillus pocheonensis TaxID=363869 RepID=A0ABT0WHX2_9BACI|nr:hypothetical protein [Neobacillus pocheonensis]